MYRFTCTLGLTIFLLNFKKKIVNNWCNLSHNHILLMLTAPVIGIICAAPFPGVRGALAHIVHKDEQGIVWIFILSYLRSIGL